MIIPCFRCGKELNSPDDSNADYVIAEDTIVRESREVLLALSHNEVTQTKLEEKTKIIDSDYDVAEVPSFKEAEQSIGEDLVKVISEVRDKDIQKTGILCPGCYKPTDTVIWGVHKQG